MEWCHLPINQFVCLVVRCRILTSYSISYVTEASSPIVEGVFLQYFAEYSFGVLRTKSVTKKEMNKCMAEIYDPGGIRTRAARLISQYHNH